MSMARATRRSWDWLTWTALAAVAILAAVSLVSQANADWYSGRDHYDSQVVWFLVGGVVFALAAFVDLRLVERSSYVVLGGCVLLLLLTALFGTEVNNSKRWLRLGGFNMQPSELLKLGVILALARWFHGRRERVPGEHAPQETPYRLRDLWQPGLMVVVPAFLVLRQPDLGTTLLVLLCAATIVLWEGVDRRTLVIVAFSALVVVPLAWKFGGIRDYQKDRVVGCVDQDWLRLDEDTATVMDKRSLQSEQAIWAIGSGQFWGQGSRSGAQSRLKYLPEMHTDMILATYSEEQGFIGVTFLLMLFWVLVVWGLRSAADSRDRYCRLLAVGVTAMVAWQVVINVGMVAGVLPVVGLTLPLISYGGSSILVTMASLGLTFNVALRRGRL